MNPQKPTVQLEDFVRETARADAKDLLASRSNIDRFVENTRRGALLVAAAEGVLVNDRNEPVSRGFILGPQSSSYIRRLVIEALGSEGKEAQEQKPVSGVVVHRGAHFFIVQGSDGRDYTISDEKARSGHRPGDTVLFHPRRHPKRGGLVQSGKRHGVSEAKLHRPNDQTASN